MQKKVRSERRESLGQGGIKQGVVKSPRSPRGCWAEVATGAGEECESGERGGGALCAISQEERLESLGGWLAGKHLTGLYQSIAKHRKQTFSASHGSRNFKR